MNGLIESLLFVAVVSVSNFAGGYWLAARQSRRAAPSPVAIPSEAHEAEMIRTDFQPVLDGVTALIARATKAEADHAAEVAARTAAEQHAADLQAQLDQERQDRADEKTAALVALGLAPASGDSTTAGSAGSDAVDGATPVAGAVAA